LNKPTKKQIQELEKISSQLEPNGVKLENYFSRIHSFSSNYLDDLKTKKAWVHNEEYSTDKLDLGHDPSLENVLKTFKEQVIDQGLVPSSGGHLGYIPGGGVYLSSLGDYLAAISNEYAGMTYPSPGAAAIENNLINWMKDLFGFPESSVGNLTSGGSIANLIGITAARDAKKIKGELTSKSVVYCNKHLHHCMLKAFRIAGLEDLVIRYVDLDVQFRLKMNHLKSLVEKDEQNGLNPFMILGNAGTTDTGSIDPLDLIGQYANKKNIWFHIDAAYGGFFQLIEEGKKKLKGIELADSLVVDPHKGLFLPYGIGAVLIKDVDAVLHSNHYVANYMLDAYEEETVHNSADLSPELTKHFRGMRMWLPLKILGIEPFKACLEEKLLLAKYLYNEMTSKGYEMGPDPELTVIYFNWNFVDDASLNNQYNKLLLEEILKDGRIFLSSTILNDKFVIRVAVLSFRTKLNTIELCMEIVDSAKNKILKEIESSVEK
jgi:glutamate/tyrosine decarboxylase-like PLP-dependent enzyme